ncbi:unnamed protein product [Spirodela intermedia]|uniref:Uncharacterized protein n=1 Tax=Spirodela intermedia TaxID=51605 RepID=A0A7I8JWB3_SPIIN|nr:unnamed protein product [Spirodela intermedia]
MGAVEILEPFELHFADLLLLSCSSPAVSPPPETERLESVSGGVMAALGPSGPGLLCVTGVPAVPALRRALLPLAQKLALLDGAERARILKSHGLGSDVPLKNPDRTVSSFAKQLKYMGHPTLPWTSNLPEHGYDNGNLSKENAIEDEQELRDPGFEQLGNTFNLLGSCMMEVGLQVARLCDRKTGGQELESSLLDSGTAKGRLIHYHSKLDNLIIREPKGRSNGSSRRPTASHTAFPQEFGILTTLSPGTELQRETKSSDILNVSRTSLADLWQQWHYDYGIFTVLTAPMFLMAYDVNGPHHISGSNECSPPDGHTCLQLFDNVRDRILMVKAPPESFIVQVGESADILSKGKLRSTLHSVIRPGLGDLCRETFVVFLQPAWDKILCISNNSVASTRQEVSTPTEAICGDHDEEKESKSGRQGEIVRAVPPLCSRLRDGMTFAEFSRETTRQYYGGGGTQSRR